MIGQAVSHYKILQKLGEGGSGVVYKALDEKLSRIVALKFFHDQPFANREQKAFLTREAQAAAALNHPNIRTIYEIDETENCLFMAMAFVAGVSLKNKLRGGPLDLQTAVSLACQVADGLETAHGHGIVHRNLNSANILITDRGLVKILNFGLASPLAEPGPIVKSAAINTTAYLSPEQLRDEPIDHRTDIWSWGVVCYELLTGKLPFKGEQSQDLTDAILNDTPAPPSEINPGIPVELDRIIARALAKPMRDRYQNLTEALAELQSPETRLGITGPTGDFSTKQLQPAIAVLAFEDMSPAKDQEYFCDGIAEEIQ